MTQTTYKKYILHSSIATNVFVTVSTCLMSCLETIGGILEGIHGQTKRSLTEELIDVFSVA
jgi:hypothetical protein